MNFIAGIDEMTGLQRDEAGEVHVQNGFKSLACTLASKQMRWATSILEYVHEANLFKNYEHKFDALNRLVRGMINGAWDNSGQGGCEVLSQRGSYGFGFGVRCSLLHISWLMPTPHGPWLMAPGSQLMRGAGPVLGSHRRYGKYGIVFVGSMQVYVYFKFEQLARPEAP